MFSKHEGFLWMDGALRPWEEATLHVLTHGLHYASCVFEGERVYDGEIYKLRRHSERLAESARILGFALPYSVEELDEASRQAVAAQGVRNGYVRPLAWRGSEMMAISAQRNTIHVAVAAWEWGSYFDPEARMQGLRLDISDWRRPSPQTAPSHSKAAGLYMICTLSKHAAEAKGYEDALMLDWRGLVSEATGANVFFAEKDRLHTPLADCFLDGITRQTVIALARERGIEVVERHIKPEEMAGFSECFITGTAAEVTPVGEIGDCRFAGREMTRMLMDAYAEETSRAAPLAEAPVVAGSAAAVPASAVSAPAASVVRKRA